MLQSAHVGKCKVCSKLLITCSQLADNLLIKWGKLGLKFYLAKLELEAWTEPGKKLKIRLGDGFKKRINGIFH